MGALRIFPWDVPESSLKDKEEALSQHFVFPGHTGPIYTIGFSPDGQKLATGGYDALVGLWDVPSMVCKSTISRRSKFIRSVSHSHDSRLVASCTEEDGVDIADSLTGDHIGSISLSYKSQSSRFGPPGGSGPVEIAFHPKAHVLACARGDTQSSVQVPQVTVAKINLSYVQ